MSYRGRTPFRLTDPYFKIPNHKLELGCTSFSKALFEDKVSQRIREAVLQTKFFLKMEDNSLSPEAYGGYTVQDAAYCFDAVKAFDRAAEQVENKNLDPDFALFYRIQSASFDDYNEYFMKQWKLKRSGCVILGPAAIMYVEFEKNLAEKYPKFLSIGSLPCDMLWPWVAQKISESVPKNGVYRSWVDANKGDGKPSKAQVFVDSHFTDSDKEMAQKIFNLGMINELNFFRSACDEELAEYGDFDDPAI